MREEGCPWRTQLNCVLRGLQELTRPRKGRGERAGVGGRTPYKINAHVCLGAVGAVEIG